MIARVSIEAAMVPAFIFIKYFLFYNSGIINLAIFFLAVKDMASVFKPVITGKRCGMEGYSPAKLSLEFPAGGDLLIL